MLSWKFDKDNVFLSIFGEKSKETQLIHRERECVEKFEYYQLPRFKGRAFSDQATVPEDLHNEAFVFAIGEVIKKCGENYEKSEMRYMEVDLEVVSYIK